MQFRRALARSVNSIHYLAQSQRERRAKNVYAWGKSQIESTNIGVYNGDTAR